MLTPMKLVFQNMVIRRLDHIVVLKNINMLSDVNKPKNQMNKITKCVCLRIAWQSGCCKPPTECGYTYVNETVWSPGTGIATNSDCTLWSNDQTQLCYSCDSCKAGVLASIKKSWRKVSVINIIVLIILVIFYVIGCAAFRNAKRIDNNEPYGESRMTKSQPARIHF